MLFFLLIHVKMSTIPTIIGILTFTSMKIACSADLSMNFFHNLGPCQSVQTAKVLTGERSYTDHRLCWRHSQEATILPDVMHLQTADNIANSANKIKFVFVQGETVLEFPAGVLGRRYYQRAHVKVEIQLSE